MSDLAKSRHDLFQEGIELGSRKLVGLANQEFTAAEKNLADAAKSFAEREDKQIDAELKRRALESDISKRQADARKAKAEADLAEVNVAHAFTTFRRNSSLTGWFFQKTMPGIYNSFPYLPPCGVIKQFELSTKWTIFVEVG